MTHEQSSQWFKVVGEGPDAVVVMIDSTDDGRPAIRIYCRPSPDLGTCNTAIGFEDSDSGYDHADAALEKFSESDAKQIVAMMLDAIK